MTSDFTDHKLLMEIFEMLNSGDANHMKPMIEAVLNTVMKLEREHALQAKPYERSENRTGHANGFKPKVLSSRMGQLQLEVPQVRGLSFYPQCIEKGSRSERALKLAVAEMYLNGVSTRKVESVTKPLCGLEFTSTQVSRATKELDEEFEKFRNRPLGRFRYMFVDAIYLKVRRNHSVMDHAVLIGCGVNEEGKREVLGISMSLSEAEVHWRTFLEGLFKRGLHGVELITSDDHAGLKAARQKVMPSVMWQRCQFHMCQNAQQYAPRKEMRQSIGEAMREIFDSRNIEAARSRINEVLTRFRETAPEFTRWLENNVEEGLTCFSFPKEHRKRLRTDNGLERMNREIKRRTRVAVLFPNMESALRLVTGVLVEIHEEWITGRTYLDMSLRRNKAEAKSN